MSAPSGPSKALPHVVFTAPLPGAPEHLLEGIATHGTHPIEETRSPDELANLMAGASGAVTLLSDPVTASVLDRCPNLRIVANYAVGYNNIDVASAHARGIAVTNTPGVLTDATADLTWALILATARRITEGHRWVVEGRFRGWMPNLLLGMDLSGKTLGILGMGRIGRAVARRALPFGMTLQYSQRTPLPESTETALRAAHLPLDVLLGTSDILSIHCPLTPETTHLLDARALQSMKPGAILINTSRGPVVDEAALASALRSGPLSAAGLDVYEKEPEIHSGLFELPNVVLLPHLGSAGTDTREAMARMAVRNVVEVLSNRPPLNPVEG